jgi:hypothetical protein
MKTCTRFEDGCSAIGDCPSKIVRIDADTFGYRACGGPCPAGHVCGWYPIYSRESWARMWGDRPFPLDAEAGA